MKPNYESPEGDNPYSAPRSASESRESETPAASLIQRLGGALVDGALMWACLLTPAIMAGGLQELLDGMQSEDPEIVGRALGGGDYTATPILIVILAGFNLWLLYKDGQTIGKRLVGSRIVRTSGMRAGFLRIIGLRAWLPGLLYMVPTVGPMLMVFGHVAVLLPARRCLHDYIADTKVVRA